MQIVGSPEELSNIHDITKAQLNTGCFLEEDNNDIMRVRMRLRILSERLTLYSVFCTFDQMSQIG